MMQYSEKILHDQLLAITTALGPAAVMKIFSGNLPRDCADSDPRGELAKIELPRQPFFAPYNRTLQILEPWIGVVSADGAAKSYRIFDSLGECHVQGTVRNGKSADDGGDGELEFESIEWSKGQKVAIEAFTINGKNR